MQDASSQMIRMIPMTTPMMMYVRAMLTTLPPSLLSAVQSKMGARNRVLRPGRPRRETAVR